MADRTVSVSLLAKVSGFVNGMRQAEKSAGDFGNKLQGGLQKNKGSIDQLSGTAGLLGAAMVGAAGFAIKAFANFDSAMSGVQAATHESAEGMAELRDAALEAGARTKFSATEAAEGIENLAKAGVSTSDILNGGLNGALDLAAAGQLEVADAAEIAATAMTQFRLTGDQIPHVADLLAAAAGKAQGEVSDMAMALKQSGLVASQFHLSIEETTGTLAAFASAGLIGSDAGTSFRTMLLRLANPAKETAELMKTLGINAYDAQGNFVGMGALAEQLRTKLGPLTQEQRDLALAQIFGSDAIRAANVLFDQGAEGIAEWTSKVDDAGYAAETAGLLMDNLAGDIETFMGSLETALIGVGEGANGPLRDLVQNATDAVNAFNDMPEGAKNALLGIVGGGGLVLLGLAGLGKLAVGISNTKDALSNLGTTGKVAGGALKFAGVVGVMLTLGTLASEVGEHFGGLNEDIQDVANSLEGFAEKGKLSGSAAKLAGGNFAELEKAIGRLGNPEGAEGFVNWADKFLSPFRGPMDVARMNVEKFDESLTNLASSGGAEDAAAVFAEVTKRAEEQGVSVEKLRELFPQYTAVMRGSKDAAEGAAEATGVMGTTAGEAAGGVADLEEKLSPTAETLKAMDDRAKGLTDSLELLNATMSNVDAESSYEQAIDDARERVAEFAKEQSEAETRTKGMKTALDLGTQAGRDNAGVLRDLWKRSGDYATETLRLTGNQGLANSKLAAGRTQLVDVATAFLGSRKAAEKYVTEVLGVPKNVSTAISQPGMTNALGNTGDLNSKLGNVPKAKSTTFTTPGLGGSYTKADQYADRLSRVPRSITTTVRLNISGANQRLLDRERAGGGPVERNLPYLVGEEGPELYVPNQTGQIFSAPQTRRMMATRASAGSATVAAGGSGSFEGNLYLDSGELLGLVRGQISESNHQIKRDVLAGRRR